MPELTTDKFPVSFKELVAASDRLDGPVVAYVPRADRVERVVRLALRFASRASVDSVQFLDSVHSVTGQVEWTYGGSDDRSGSENLRQ